MDRRIAYAKRKYHSGTIWAGVDKGFEAIKLSGSPRRNGEKKTRERRAVIITTKPNISLIVDFTLW